MTASRSRALSAAVVVVMLAAGTAVSAGSADSGPGSGGDSGCNPGYSKPFAPWGDEGKYVLMPNGALESSGGWDLRDGARLVSGNESYYVNSKEDSRSLLLPSGSSATSPTLCTELFQPKLRLFAMNAGSSRAGLRIEVTTVVAGVRRTGLLGTLSAAGGWQPTAPLPFLQELEASTIGTVSFRFTAVNAGSGFRIDDVYVDYPFKGR